MSKNSGGYMGIQVGKLGPAVGTMWKGCNVYRAHNPFVRNPKTPKQQINRARFAVISNLARAFSSAINFGYKLKGEQEHTTTRGLFVHDNWAAVHASTPDSVTVDYATLKISDGNLTNVAFGAPQFDTPLQVDVDFEATAVGAATDDDLVYLLVYCPDANQAICAPGTGNTPVKREDEAISVKVPSSWNGMKVHIWGFTRAAVDEPTFVSAYNGYIYPNQCSNSSYIGSGNIS